jgi:hypothetical protein
MDYWVGTTKGVIPRASSDFIALTFTDAGTGGPGKYFDSECPVGRRLSLGRQDKPDEMEVVGVIPDMKDGDLAAKTPSRVVPRITKVAV